jgi:membrane-anchored mycosin MYCP
MTRKTLGALAPMLGAVLGVTLLAAQVPALAAPASPGGSRSGRSGSAGVDLVPVTASTPTGCQQAPSSNYGNPEKTVPATPWAEQALDFNKVWSLNDEGGGVTVAVIDSGVDYSPQLAGRLTATDLTGTGLGDCVGHGTGVAGIIGASNEQTQGNPFVGVAPAVNIISVKVMDSESTSNAVAGNLLAQGIEEAADLHVGVISISITSSNTPELQNAVNFALSHNVVVVAAGGNDESIDGQTQIGPFYPAAYPGVLSVGALEPDGSLASFSDLHSNVAVTAPGADVTSTWPGQEYAPDYNGTSFATPFVSGVAALVRARYPTFNEAQVVQRIEETADGTTGTGTGFGMVNPLQAVAAVLPPVSASGSALRPHPVSVTRALPPDTGTRDAAMLATTGGIGGAVLLILASLVIRAGRRRGWRPGRVVAPAREPPGSAPPPPDPEPAALPAETGGIFGDRW